MAKSIYKIIKEFRSKSVLVIGDAMLDAYYCGTSKRICREAPVPIVDVTDEKYMPGGAANSALNSAKLGASCKFISLIGDDKKGELLIKILNESGVDTSNVFSEKGKTISKERVVANGQILVRYDFNNHKKINIQTEKKIINALEQEFPKADCIIISDYRYGFLTDKVIERLKTLQAKYKKIISIDAKNIKRYETFPSTFVKQNYDEALRYLGTKSNDTILRIDNIQKNKEELVKLKAGIVAVTVDSEGSVVIRDGKVFKKRTTPQLNPKTAGAGDTYTAAFTLALSSKASIKQSMSIATAAASIVVGKDFTANCTQNELIQFLSSNNKMLGSKEEIDEVMCLLRDLNKKVVFTNGCFDILHSGHITYLRQAKSLGDILIVGLNTDASIKRLKGPQRPINALFDRVQVLSALSFVDYIIPFATDTPVGLIRQVKPDIYVKGGDYTKDELPEAPVMESMGGSVKILPYIEGYSTTSLVKKIRSWNTKV